MKKIKRNTKRRAQRVQASPSHLEEHIFNPGVPIGDRLDLMLTSCEYSSTQGAPDTLQFLYYIWTTCQLESHLSSDQYYTQPISGVAQHGIYAAVLNNIVHIKQLLHKRDHEISIDRLERRFQLLIAAAEEFSSQTPRSQEILSVMKDPTRLVSYHVPHSVSDLTQFELRHYFFIALQTGLERDAFRLLGKLKEDSHHSDEIIYLEGLAWFSSQEFSRARECMQLVKTPSVDFFGALIHLAQIFAIEGDLDGWTTTVESLKERHLSLSFQGLLALQLIMNAENITEACARVLKYFPTLPEVYQDSEIDQVPADNFTVDFCIYQTKLILELWDLLCKAKVQLHLWDEHTDHSLSEVLSENDRYQRLISALSITMNKNDLECLDQQLTRLRYRTRSMRRIEINFKRRLLELDYECLLRIGDEEALLDQFISDYHEIKPEHLSSIAPMVYPALSKSHLPQAQVIFDHYTSEARFVDQVCPVGLSTMGEVAYRAALITLKGLSEQGDRWTDGGLASLGFFRILEIELVSRLIKPALNDLDLRILSETYAQLSARDQKQWDMIHSAIYRDKDPDLFTIKLLIEKCSKVKPTSTDHKYRDMLRAAVLKYLTPQGVEALNHKEISKIIADEVRLKFRNPPAHTRYLPFFLAEECKEHVDDGLKQLNKWLRR